MMEWIGGIMVVVVDMVINGSSRSGKPWKRKPE